MANQKFENCCIFDKDEYLKVSKIQTDGSNIADQKFESSSIFEFLICYIELKNSLIRFRFNDPKNLNYEIIKWIERVFCHCSSK